MVGTIWKQAEMVSSTRLGEVSRLLTHNHVGNLVEGMDLDVLPLPIERELPVEGGILKAIQGGTIPKHF